MMRRDEPGKDVLAEADMLLATLQEDMQQSATCPDCHQSFSATQMFCPDDGELLIGARLSDRFAEEPADPPTIASKEELVNFLQAAKSLKMPRRPAPHLAAKRSALPVATSAKRAPRKSVLRANWHALLMIAGGTAAIAVQLFMSSGHPSAKPVRIVPTAQSSASFVASAGSLPR